MLEECGLHTLEEYVRRRRQTIVAYVVDRPLLVACREGERQRGTPCRQWWWEQEMDLDEQPPILEASYDSSDFSGALDDVGGSTWWVIGLRDRGRALIFCSNHFKPSKKSLGRVARAHDAVIRSQSMVQMASPARAQ